MKNRFDEYGLTRELVEPDSNFELLSQCNLRAEAEEIRETISLLVPQPSDHQLILIGGRRDGGYLIPNDLVGIEACFSPGVNNFKNFEDELAVNFGINSFMCDFSSDPENFLTPIISGMQHFEKKWLDINGRPDSIDLDDWVHSRSNSERDLLLQMDIEGAEYRNILYTSRGTLSRFRIISIELHGLNLLGELSFLRGIFSPTIRKLADLFRCVHAHPNNCCGVTDLGRGLVVPNVLEVTLLRHDRVGRTVSSRVVLPNPLDIINVPDHPPLHLSGFWLEHADPASSELSAIRQSVEWLAARVQSLSIGIHHNTQELRCISDLSIVARVRALDQTLNVARGKVATQSSLSVWSTAQAANGAINGVKNGAYGFHTLYESNPWWMVDLRGAFSISDIAIYNRVDSCPERSRTLRASISLDGVRWHLVYDHSNREPFGGMGSSKPPLLIMLADACARYVKLECVGQTCFHLDEVEIFGTPVPSPDDFLKKVTGVIHIGANSGQERERYERYGLSVIWVEPIPEIFEKLQANIREYPRQRAYNCLVTDRVNHSYEFNISNNAGESSSILDLALHKDVWPGVEYTRTITLVSTTLEALVGKQGINISGYQALVLDTQGSELLVLKGAGELLRSFSYVKAEAPDFESYLGCCQIGDLSDYLGGFGFRELQRTKFSEHPTAGCYYDVVYERSPN